MCTGSSGRLAARLKKPSWKIVLRNCAVFLLCVTPFGVSAANDVPLTLAEAVRLAMQQEPGEMALRARADALASRAAAAGELPVPQWRAGLANYPLSGGGFDREPMTMAQFGIQQMFPAGDTRALQRDLLLTESQGAALRAAGRSEFVREAASMAWLDVYYWVQAERLVRQTRPWIDDLAVAVRAHYAAGHKGQKDLVRAELEVARIDQRLLELGLEEQQARAGLSEWIGDAALRPIATAMPESEIARPLSALLENLRQHPEMQALNARVAASDRGIGIARENFKAGWGLSLTYGYRSGTGADGRARSDMISIQVTRDLPFLGRAKQNNALEGALQERRATEAEVEATYRRLSAKLQDAFARYNELAGQIAYQEKRILPLAQFEAEAALTAYQNDQGEFSELAMARVQVLQSQLELLRLQVARSKAQATIANLGGSQS